MPLGERAARAFDTALDALDDDADARLVAQLREARAGLGEPMRVAVVGRIKAGKSTLMNALLGTDVAPVGTTETTFTVSWFVHSTSERLVVHYKDERGGQEMPMVDLPRLVVRTGGDPGVLASIKHLQVGLPLPILRRLELIDTPGFGSVYETDSRNTLDLLGLRADDVDSSTQDHARSADAIVYLFNRGLTDTDRDRAEEFQGASLGDVTPVNAFAVLTKADAEWQPGAAQDPLQRVAAKVERLRAEHGLDRIFYDVLPVCGQLGFGATQLDDTDLQTLTDLARAPAAVLARRLRYASAFGSTEYADLLVPAPARAKVAQRIGLYGIWTACELVRDGVADLSGLRDALVERSGVGRVRGLLLDHFGNRAATIKAWSATARSRALLHDASRPRGAARRRAATAYTALEAFEDGEHAFAELRLLRSVYADEQRLGLSDDEVEEVLALTGEHGTSCADRLRHRGDPAELLELAQARAAHWRRRAGGFGLTSRAVHAAQTVQRSYEVVAFHVYEAQRHLAMDL